MNTKKIKVNYIKNVALVAHDNKKDDLLKWVEKHKDILSKHKLIGTGTTAALIAQNIGLDIKGLISGPLGGDQQLGAKISENEIDVLIFFWDPMNAAPHDPDVKALMRIATVWDIPTAINQASADFLIWSSLFNAESEIEIPDYQRYLAERLT